tara:strand:+ start:354 stop:527 length:174 start_codon:yes stop_codon:yes gene_type:complete
MQVKAICLKSYIQEDDLRDFLEGKILFLSQDNVFIKGKEYLVVDKYYNKKYFKLILK